MLNKIPATKLKSSLKNRFDAASLPKIHSMAWLNYEMFLKRLARLAADNAKQDKSAVIRENHVRNAAKTILGGIRG
ncbi:centromere protein W-like [Mercenaria mercenaria]|uniref:centromere protein W-like n=1 Tax=Mercenaria mercenaria TaxID=6596 RepID=UPI00234F4EF0|nr:centromere protein W-like [Mercenaria mercenaria]